MILKDDPADFGGVEESIIVDLDQAEQAFTEEAYQAIG